MHDLALQLSRRRSIAILVILTCSLLSILVDYNFDIQPSTYFDGKYNNHVVTFLIIYKLIELPILSYFLFYSYIFKVVKEINKNKRLEKMKKHTKLLFFLIPQGNIVFGLIAYKVSGDVLLFLIFCFIGLSTLIIINPNSIKNSNKQI